MKNLTFSQKRKGKERKEITLSIKKKPELVPLKIYKNRKRIKKCYICLYVKIL